MRENGSHHRTANKKKTESFKHEYASRVHIKKIRRVFFHIRSWLKNMGTFSEHVGCLNMFEKIGSENHTRKDKRDGGQRNVDT